MQNQGALTQTNTQIITCKKCGEILIENGKIIQKHNIIGTYYMDCKKFNKDNLFPCYLCDTCYKKWAKYLNRKIATEFKGNEFEEKDYTEFWNKTFREWLGESIELIMFI